MVIIKWLKKKLKTLDKLKIKNGGLKNERKIISIWFYSVYMCDMDNVPNDLRIKNKKYKGVYKNEYEKRYWTIN